MKYSIVKFNNIKNIFRLDAEYFHPIALKYESLISRHHGKTFRDIKCKVVSGPFGSSLRSEAYISSGVPFLRISDLNDFFIFKDNIVYISEKDNNKLSSSQLKVGDLVLSKVGNTIGIVSKITADIGNCNISENNLGIRLPKNISDSFRDYILSYLNSKIGQIQILRLISGNAQPKLNVYDIENLCFPIFSNNFYNQISNLVEESFKQIQISKILYKQAKQLLLSELGLLNWKLKQEFAFVKKFSDTQQAERMDSEYFQPKYEEIVEAIKRYKGGFDELENLIEIKKSIEPGSEAYQENGIPFVRVSNLSKFELSNNNQQFISKKLYDELKKYQPQKGEILLSKDATPGIAYYLNEVPKQMIVSGGILRLKIESHQILPEYLTLVLNSVVVQKQIERDVGGSIINHWKPDQIKTTIIPILDNAKQKEIKKLIEKSFFNKEQSKLLLEIAKRGVEIAIEKNEEEAEKWIYYELDKIGGICNA
jgi:restriction endonuclease S subunit